MTRIRVILLIASLLVVAGDVSAFGPLFDVRVNYGAGDYPTSVFAVDLDGDGDNDLAVANHWSDNVSVLLNNGDGTFQPAANYGAGDQPSSVFAVDLDGDSHNDLAVANWGSDNVSVLLNNGDGTFQAAVNYGAGDVPRSVFAVDLDGDGDNDLTVANAYSDNVSVLLNNGDGTFQAAANYRAGDYPLSVFAVDLDGDGDNDLVVANLWSGDVSVLLNNGDGTFQTVVNYGAGMGPTSVFAVDLDGDGDNDLAVSNFSNNVSILLNNGDGTFQAPVNYGAGNGPWSVFAVDLDGDGDNDLAVANSGSDISILMNLSSTTAVSIEIIPDDPPVRVPQGGSFGFTGTLTNNSDQPQVIDAGTMAIGPEKDVYGPFKKFLDLELAPYETRTAHFDQRVNGQAPLGFYNYIAYCGDWPSTVIDSSFFEVEAVTGISGSGRDLGWLLSGSFDKSDDFPSIPSEFALHANCPNPFNARTEISYQLPVATEVKLEIYNLLGQKVARLVDERQQAGYRSIVWNASDVSSGLYFYKLTAGDFAETRRMMLVK